MAFAAHWSIDATGVPVKSDRQRAEINGATLRHGAGMPAKGPSSLSDLSRRSDDSR